MCAISGIRTADIVLASISGPSHSSGDVATGRDERMVHSSFHHPSGPETSAAHPMERTVSCAGNLIVCSRGS